MPKRDEKAKIVQDIKNLAGTYRTIGVLDMSKLPARQFLKIKNVIASDGNIRIKMSRKGLLARALNESGKPGIEKLTENMSGSPAIIFSNHDPFKLFSILKKNRARTSAKIDAVVEKDVVAPKGPTQISPGPAITTLSKVGLKTRVEGGKISILDQKVILKAGQTVTSEIAAVLGLLKIEPVEIGMKMMSAWEGGTVYGYDILNVDTEQYLRDIEKAVHSATNLSLNSGYITSQTAPMAIQLAFWRAKSLCVSANILEKDVIGEILAKAVAEAKALEEKVPSPPEAPAQEQAPAQ